MKVNPEYTDLVEMEASEDLTYDDGFSREPFPMMLLTQTEVPRKIVSIAWTDLQNPGCGKASDEYVLQAVGLISGTEQEYTFYFQPTVYTVAEGHHLELILTTWNDRDDPFCSPGGANQKRERKGSSPSFPFCSPEGANKKRERKGSSPSFPLN